MEIQFEETNKPATAHDIESCRMAFALVLRPRNVMLISHGVARFKAGFHVNEYNDSTD